MRRKERVLPLVVTAWFGVIACVVGTNPPQNCADLFATGTRQSGTYTVGEPSPYYVYCDMSFLGGGWTVLQRRQDGSVDFAKTWEEYQQGFGDLGGEFWLGLDKIHTLTSAKSNILQIELEDFDGERRYARYGTFSVGDSNGNYVVTIAGYTGDAGNSLTNSGRPDINGRMFSTIDRDNDGNSDTHCADRFSNGGWWYPLGCGQSFLNGRYNCHLGSVRCGASQGVVWSGWGGRSYFLKKTTIMIRPADFTGSDTPQDCADLYEDGIIESGINAVSDPRVSVYCDMRNHGGGWTLLQRRQDGSVDFAKNWATYEQGFGNLDGEHWLGLSKQNQITGQKVYSLRVDLGDWENQFRYATYSSFTVGGSNSEYQVGISGYTGDAGDSLTSGGNRFNINGVRFTTSDNDNDPNTGANCASSFSGGGWWYPASCGYALLNGQYNGTGSAMGVNWQRWRGYAYSLKMASLKVRPAAFSVCTGGKFGDGCSSTCRCLEGNSDCNHKTGSCLGLCARGWMGSDCQTACSPGTYGPSCKGTCRCAEPNAACNVETGVCTPAGCIAGWVGDSCDTLPTEFVQPVPQDEGRDVGEDVSWVCKAKGYPYPVITWQHGGNDLATTGGSDVMIVTSESSSGNDMYTESALSINSVGRQHDGDYTCSASNRGASPQTSFSLTVRDTPDKPSVNSDFVSEPTAITITWSFPTDTGNLPITESLVEYRELTETSWTPETIVGQLKTYTFPNLQPFSVFYVRVSVKNRLGYSDTTDPVRIWSAPGKVQQLDREILSASEMRLTWDSPDPTEPQDIISHYEVAYGLSEDTIGDPVATANGGEKTTLLSNLTPNSTYIIKVWAVTSAGNGEEQAKSILFEYVPSQPLDLVVNNVGECACVTGSITDKAAVTAMWSVPVTPNGQILGYRVSYNTEGQSEQMLTFPTNVVTQEVGNLELQSKYSLKVAAYNSLFNGTDSDLATVTTAEGCPGPPVDVQAVQLSLASAVHCSISWSAPDVTNGVITGYKVHYRTSWNLVPSYTNENTESHSNEETSVTATSLRKEVGPNKKLSVRVSAITCNEGEQSEELEFVCINSDTAPPPPLTIPDVPQDEITSSSFIMDIQRASSVNGPICCYQIIVVPMKVDESLETLRDIGLREATVLTGNDVNAALRGRDLPYVADAFSSDEFISSITIGNGQPCDHGCCTIGPTGHPDGNVHNKRLAPNTKYTVTVRAFSVCSNGRRRRQATSTGSDRFTSSEFIPPQQTGGDDGGGGSPGATGPVVGAIVGVIAVAAIVAGIIVARRKCPFQNKRDSMGGSSTSSARGADNLAQLENLAPDQDPDHAKPPIAPRKPEPKKTGVAAKPTAASASARDYSQPVPVDSLEQVFNKRHANDDQLFTEEYKALPGDLGMAHAKAYLKKPNGEKNRFKNVIAYDNDRVVLTPVAGDPDSDYIHASYIDGYNEERKFIAAQGPKPNTVHDFWRMMWETGSTVIVMVTNLEEKGKTKCTQYWPESGEEVYGQISVTLADTIPMVYYVTRVLLVSKGDEKQRKITQFQFLGWPDFGAPRNPAELLKFHQKVMTSITPCDRPIVVHCSAGVGRTGTFITMDAMLSMMAEEGRVDVFGFVSKTRQSRSQMVQAEAQYVFIYRALMEQHLYGDTEIEVTSIHRHLQNLKREDQLSHKTGLELEFEKLTRVPVDKANMRNGNLPENISKNRVLQVLPYDTSRVFLQHKTGVTGSDYINASFIDGYRERDAYIATQGPLDRTVEDFWRMVWEWNSCSIVMLTELQEKDRSTCARYWPEEGSKAYGDLIVKLDDQNEFGDFTHRIFTLENRKGDKSRNVHQFHFHGWPEHGAPDNAAGIIDLIGQVQKQQQLSGNGPITIHCSSGAGRTGTFCAISTVLERVKTEGNCDVFQTVKALRQQRPHMVQTIDQYQFCYQAVVEYLDSFDHYSNFA